MYECVACGERFGGLWAFDRHLRPIATGPSQPLCHDPATRGLTRGKRGTWGRSGALVTMEGSANQKGSVAA